MKLEKFNLKLIENIFLGANIECPFDSTLFIEQQKDEINQIAGISGFDIIHIELPQENVLCDAYAIDENQGNLIILIGDITKNKKEIEELSTKEAASLLEKGKSFVEHMLKDNLRNMIDESEEDQHSAIEEIYESSLRIENINFYIITNKIYNPESENLKDGLINNINYSPLVISLIDFYEFWKTKSSDFITPNIDFQALGHKLPFLKLQHNYEDYNGYLVVMNAKALFDIYDEHETDLLQGNVRFFLNATRKQNKGLIETLSNDRQNFFAYNNGISATANSIQVFEEDGEQYIKTVDNLQIVNGGQTTATIHFFGKKEEKNLKLLDDVYLQMKLNVIKNRDIEETFVHDISKFANTQSTVSFSDLDANDTFNIQFEKHSRVISIPKTNGEKWFYERKTGDYFTTGLNLERKSSNDLFKFKNEFKKERLVKKTEVAILLFAWGFYNENNNIEPRPYDSALGAEKNYDKFKKYRENNLIEVDSEFYKNTISKVILARKIAKLVNEAGIKQQRNHVVNYTLGLMSLLSEGKIDFNLIWNNQDISEQLAANLSKLVKKVWKEIQRSAGPINLSTWCRKVECWLEIKELKHSFSKTIPEFKNYSNVDEIEGTKPIVDDGDPIIEVPDEISSFKDSLADETFWFALSKWAKENDILNSRARAFCFNMGKYISRGYELTDKQLKYAEACFDEACSNGYIQNNETEIEKTYFKLITPQDIARTPSISTSAAVNFFNLNLDHGKSTVLPFKFNHQDFEIEINKRNTRNEYRFFINRMKSLIGYETEDILIFTKIKDFYNIDLLQKPSVYDPNSDYVLKLEKMEGNTHVLI